MSKAEKKKKKKKNNDAIAILVIFAVIIIAILVMVFFGSQSNVSKLNGVGGRKNSEKDSGASFEIILVCGFLTVFVITFLVIKKVRDGKRKAKLRAEQMEKARKMEELKNAKERVRRAKMNEFLTAGESELEKRRRDKALLRNNKNQNDRGGIRDSEEYRRRDLVGKTMCSQHAVFVVRVSYPCDVFGKSMCIQEALGKPGSVFAFGRDECTLK